MKTVVDSLAPCSQLSTLSISLLFLTKELADVLSIWLSTSTSLSEFALTVYYPILFCEALIISEGLAASNTLTKVTFGLVEECGVAWASALETGLSADTPLTSVDLKIFDSVSDTTAQALERLLSNKSLTSLSLIVCGDMQDQLAAALGKGLSGQTFLNSLDVQVKGKLGICGAHYLERGLLENRSLNY